MLNPVRSAGLYYGWKFCKFLCKMRVPYVIEVNTKLVYDPPPDVVARFGNETGRKLRAENYQWDSRLLETLAMLCLKNIAANFVTNPIIDKLMCEDRDILLELLPTDLDLELVIPLIEDEYYWERRYQVNFGTQKQKEYIGWTWKSIFLERYIQQVLEQAQPQYKDEESFDTVLELSAPYVHRLSITQLQQWRPPKTSLPEEHPQVYPTTHISFLPIFQRLTCLTHVEICYGMNNVEVDYEPHMFQVAVKDMESLGSAILYLTHLRVLRIYKSWLECDHIKALMKKLIFNISLLELDLSHCRIGNMGAQCIGMMLNVHENLKILTLKNNRITEQGALGLAWALIQPEGTFLDQLDLSLNPLGHGGTMAMLRALVRTPHPLHLSLASCNIQGITAVRVGGMLGINSALETLDISNNNFGQDGGSAILASMQKNNTLYEMNIDHTNIPEDVKCEIRQALKRNLGLRPVDPYEYTEHSLTFGRTLSTMMYSDDDISGYSEEDFDG